MLNSLRSNTARFARLILFNFYPKIWNVTHLFLLHTKIYFFASVFVLSALAASCGYSLFKISFILYFSAKSS
ncbi:hypothetical protein CA845_03485 [Fusobacterium polymorphum]|uniref:Uncharacterized protein n=1 Tax=Fusobacterium nucleatum subsp. polymorphum TaxID=76857 RepID=A0A2C5ZHP0_FUSNP|nr:hypothetical protein CA836_03645 [Fusobacterium polymorphum]PHI09168.1 hypothetical protein CA845_03485 [Fusobacterium polymorphum]PIM76267.1 hypothetical protein CTM65_10330 [Fusobacterium polymorphum]